jgi:hypothetical protein
MQHLFAGLSMISVPYRKIAQGLIAIGIVLLIAMPDTVAGLFVEFMHVLFESLLHLADILFEGIESTLDTIVEHIFETDLHQTQVIVFYVMMLGAFIAVYSVCRKLPALYNRLKEKLLATWMLYKMRTTLYWQTLPTAGRIKLFAVAGSVFYLIFLVSF